MRPAHAVILAGGRGTRLLPFTATIPKPLVPIGDDCAILEIVLRQLARQRFDRVTVAIGHLGEIIRAYVGDGSQWGLSIDYATEDRPLGTMGPVVAVLDRLPEQFLVLNGDILTDLSFRRLLSVHNRTGGPLTIATYVRHLQVDFGVLEVADDHVIGFTEKPALTYAVSMGVYALSRATLAGYPAGEPLGFDRLVLDLLAGGTPPRTLRHRGYWLDIGRPDDYEQANHEFPHLRGTLLPGP